MQTTLFRLAWLLCLIQASCEHLGPQTIVTDRLPYNQAVATSWKEQTLLNIVKLRYIDTPFFIEVPQIVSGYTIQDGVSATASITPPVSPLASFAQQLGAVVNFQGAYQDRPTISYAPQTGSGFIRNLTTPITPGAIMLLIQSGYPADVVLNLAVESINGVNNRSVTGGQIRPAEPEFGRVVQAIRQAQISGRVGIRVDRDKEKRESLVMLFRDRNIDPAMARELDEVRKILGLDPSAKELRVVFGATSSNPTEIAILSRSVLRILTELATFVEVPPEHLAAGIAPDIGDQTVEGAPLFRVLSCATKPPDAFAAVCYEGHWFWIDKRDTQSKRTMAYLLVMLALSETGSKEGLPLLTIQAN